MHNNIMAAGSRDHPPMLATGRYAQWRSRFLRYIDTRPMVMPSECVLKVQHSNVCNNTRVVPVTENSPKVLERTVVETVSTMSLENKDHYESEKEAIHLILTVIGDEIYSTVNACKTTHEMWEAIERLQQGESLNIQDVKTNLFWEFGKFTSHDGETIESYYTRLQLGPKRQRRVYILVRLSLALEEKSSNMMFFKNVEHNFSRISQ
ncbi:hypothetical protein Tco_0776330 [Tanacetum coccineum]